MDIPLYDHQKIALEKIHNGCILCGGVGTGKSRTALAYYFVKVCCGEIERYKKMEQPLDLYIITTAKKRDSHEWERELIPFLLSPSNTIYSNKVIVDSWNNIGKYAGVENSFFIFDEQRVVGSGAWVKAYLKIAKSNKWILLTATPGDTWLDYIPVFIANGFYKNRTEFKREHVVYSRYTRYPKVERYLESRKLERLKKQILVDMPFEKPTISHDEWVQVDYDHTNYLYAFRNRFDIFKNEPVRDAGRLCYLLRKIVNSDPSRIEMVKKLLERHDRIIIFYNFDYELEELRKLDGYLGLKLSEWNGHKHQHIPDCERWLYLVQYAAGSEGWNCITTNAIIFFSQNYSYKSTVQAAGRIDRMNTPYRDLYYYHFKSRSSIDSAIYKAFKRKKNFNERSFAA